MGALPQLYAATAPGVRGGDYFGPDGLGELWGQPEAGSSPTRARRTPTRRAPVGAVGAASPA